MNITFGDILVYISCYFGLATSFYFFITLYKGRHHLKDNKLVKFPKVTVVVPAYNEEDTLAKTLDSLLSLDYPKTKLQIIVVDDGSKDKTLSIAQEYQKKHPNILALHQQNSGKGRALNNAIAHATGEFFGCLDADSFVEPDALQKIIARFDDKNTMAVTPSMKVYKPRNFFEIIQEMEYMIGIYLRKVFSMLGSVHVTPGPFSFFRKSFFEKYGGYDENNPTEDIELALRIQSKGYHIDNASTAYVHTVAPKKFQPLLKQRLRWYQGFFLNLEKYTHLFNPKTGNLGLILLPSAIFSLVLSIVLLGYTLFVMLRGWYHTSQTVLNLGLDYFRIMSWRIDFFQFGNDLTFLIIVTTIISIGTFIIANKMAGSTEKFAVKFIIFTLFYWFFYGMWWLLAIIYRIFGAKVKWGGRSI